MAKSHRRKVKKMSNGKKGDDLKLSALNAGATLKLDPCQRIGRIKSDESSRTNQAGRIKSDESSRTNQDSDESSLLTLLTSYELISGGAETSKSSMYMYMYICIYIYIHTCIRKAI